MHGRSTGLNERPLPEEELMVCVVEKPLALHAKVRSPRPCIQNGPLRHDSEYMREGTANPSAGLRRRRAGTSPRYSEPQLAELADLPVEMLPTWFLEKD